MRCLNIAVAAVTIIVSTAMAHLQAAAADEQIPDGVIFERDIEYSIPIVDRLKASAVEAQLMTIDGADHGFRGATEEVKAQIEEARVAFFDKHLKRS